MAFVYGHLKTPQNTGSGVSDFFLFAPVSDFTTIGCPPASGAAAGDEVIVVDDHVFAVGGGFNRVVCAPFKNQLKAATTGEVGSQKFQETLEVFVSGSYAAQHEFIKYLNNTPVIVLVKDANCAADMWYQLGCDCLYAWATTEFETGTVKDGQKGYKITFTYYTDAVILYGGTVTEK